MTVELATAEALEAWLSGAPIRHAHPEWLVSFLAVAEVGSFSLAARQLHSSQSRISNHVARLETLARVELIDRTFRPVGVTAAGQIMVDHARRVLQALDEASEALTALGDDHRLVS